MERSVIKVGVACMNLCISSHLKEELAWAIEKWLLVISNTNVNKNSYTKQ